MEFIISIAFLALAITAYFKGDKLDAYAFIILANIWIIQIN